MRFGRVLYVVECRRCGEAFGPPGTDRTFARQDRRWWQRSGQTCRNSVLTHRPRVAVFRRAAR